MLNNDRSRSLAKKQFGSCDDTRVETFFFFSSQLKLQMVIWDAHLIDDVIEATTCEFAVSHPNADVLIAEIEAYE